MSTQEQCQRRIWSKQHGNSRAVVSVTGDNSDGLTSTGVGTDGTTSTRTIDSEGGATSEQENSSSRLISVEDSFDIIGGGPRTEAAPTRVIDSSERSSGPIDGTVAATSGVQAVDHLGRVCVGTRYPFMTSYDYPTCTT